MFPLPFTSCGITFPSSPTPLPPGITETVLLAPCVAHACAHTRLLCGKRQGSSPQNDIRSKVRGTCRYSNEDALGFQGIKASDAHFLPLVQADDVVVTRLDSDLKKPSLAFALLEPGQRLPRNSSAD